RTPLGFDSIQRMTRVENSILVVDDDLASRRLLARTLTAAGYTCAEAESGEEALELVRKQPPCLLLLDYDMPGLNGADVSKQIRADSSPVIAQIPTIMLTGHGGEESEVLCLEAGADDFVTKPIHPEVLRAVDRDFRSILGARSFMTAMCVALDPPSGAGSIVGAGHPPLLVARHNGETESIASTSPPLGLVAGSSFSETPVRLSSGDLFLLYTDGLYGAGETDHPRLAPAMVAKQLLAVPGNAQSFVQPLLRDSASSSTTPVPPDDIAALVVRRFNGKN